MALSNGRVMMRDSVNSSTFSPTSGIPQSVTSSTLDDASIEELDRIMDTLSTLSREASKARGVNHDHKKYALPSPPVTEETEFRSYPDINQSTTSFNKHLRTPAYPIPTSITIPPPTTSPPQTPMQHQRNFTSHPKVMTLAATPSHQTSMHYPSTRSDARNPATIPRLPANPYENTSILHGSHVTVRPSTLVSGDHTNPFPLVPDSPYVNKHPSVSDGSGQCFFGHIPVSTTRETNMECQQSTTQPQEIASSSTNNSGNDFHNMRSQGEVASPHRPTRTNHEAHTLPAYNEKRSYLKNLEKGTLPRPKIDSVKQLNSQNATPSSSRKHKQKPSISDDTGDTLNRLSMKRVSKRTQGKFGVYNLSKPSSRHSTSSFNSFDLGRGYASVSTAPASTHGLIQHEILPHGRKKGMPSPLANPKSPESSQEDENCCVKYGRFLYSHVLELLILVAFCAGLPAGIVIQATRFHTTEQFHKYYAFWGSTMLPMVLSTITPLLVVSSMLSGIGNLTNTVLKRLSVLTIIYFTSTTVAAIAIAVMFSYVLDLGSLNSNFTINGTMSKESIAMSGGVIAGIAGKGQHTNVYNTTEHVETIVTDEILRFIQMLFPGCGIPVTHDIGEFCNLFVLAFFAGVVGIGASIMNLEGGPIRHVFSQIGVVMSNMADILLWYVPFGVFFIISELVATKLNWTQIGYDSQLDKVVHENTTHQSLNLDVITLDYATKRFVLAVVCSSALFSLVVMPVIACLLTLSRPCSAMSFRVIAPLITSFTIGFSTGCVPVPQNRLNRVNIFSTLNASVFEIATDISMDSDLCIPLTLRSLLKTEGISECCKSRDNTDRRIVRASVVLGGIFHRAGTAILLTCSAIFLARIEGQALSVGTIMIIGCRVAAFADTVVDAVGAHILYHYCKSKLRDIQDRKNACQDEESTDSSNVGSKIRETSPTHKMNPPRSTSGETSDYEEAPLLFNRSIEGGNESSSMNSRNDDVFLPNRPQDSRPKPQQDSRRTNNHLVQSSQHGEVSFVTF